MTIVTNLHLKLSDSSLKSQKLLLQSRLLALEGSDLLLNSAVLSLLKIEVSLHFFLDSDKLIWKTFLDICSFHSQDRLKSILFGSEDLNFFFMIVQLGGDIFDLLLKIVMALLIKFEVFPWERLGWNRSFGRFSWSCYECFAFL